MRPTGQASRPMRTPLSQAPERTLGLQRAGLLERRVLARPLSDALEEAALRGHRVHDRRLRPRAGQQGRGLCPLHYKHHLNAGRFCTVDGCDRPLRSAGLCRGHYRQKRDGVALTPIAPRREQGTGSINRLGYKEITVAPNIRRLEHRVVMERLLGRELKRTEHVHHRNGNRLDNRPENLEIWTTGQPNGQRVRDLLVWLARDYPALFLAHSPRAMIEIDRATPQPTPRAA
jgi:HNH endonuclease